MVDSDQDEGKRSLLCNGDEKRDLDLLAEQGFVEGRCENVIPDGTDTMGPERNERLGFEVGVPAVGFIQTSGLERATRRGLEGKPYG